MRVSKSSNEQVAETNANGKYVCGLKKKDNTKSEHREFDEIKDAAMWLLQNPTWGIRMNLGWSLIHRDVAIESDRI